jgi:hypothetical protein
MGTDQYLGMLGAKLICATANTAKTLFEKSGLCMFCVGPAAGIPSGGTAFSQGVPGIQGKGK